MGFARDVEERIGLNVRDVFERVYSKIEEPLLVQTQAVFANRINALKTNLFASVIRRGLETRGLDLEKEVADIAIK